MSFTPINRIRNKIFDTYPVTIHFPAVEGRGIPSNMTLWNRIYGYAWHKFKPEFFNQPDNLTIVTFNSRETPGVLESFCYRYDIRFTVLGKGIKEWLNTMKFQLMLDFLPNVKTEYIGYFDGDDVLFLDNLSRLTEFASKRHEPIIVGGELAPWPARLDVSCKFYELRKNDSPFMYINSGQAIIRTEYAKHFFESLQKQEAFATHDPPDINYGGLTTEQCRWYGFYFDNPDKVYIDSTCEIFQVMSPKTNAKLILNI